MNRSTSVENLAQYIFKSDKKTEKLDIFNTEKGYSNCKCFENSNLTLFNGKKKSAETAVSMHVKTGIFTMYV